jgi:hypothetical protein
MNVDLTKKAELFFIALQDINCADKMIMESMVKI